LNELFTKANILSPKSSKNGENRLEKKRDSKIEEQEELFEDCHENLKQV
jgi:hypothetical protein